MAQQQIKLDITAEVTAAQTALSPAVKRLNKILEKLALDKLPVGVVADALYDLKQLTKMLNTLTAPFDDLVLPSVKLVEAHFVSTLAVGESSGTQGMRSRIQITETAIPVPDDWPKTYAHIKTTGEFELLNKQLNREAVKERWDAKKQVPGVTKFIAKKVSCTKLSGK